MGLIDKKIAVPDHRAAHPEGFATRAIHAGYNALDEKGALCPPVHLTSTFVASTAEEIGEMFAGEREGHFYSRVSNPTVDILEKRIAALEGTEAALGTGSGMGAITAALWTLVQPGDEVLVDRTLYGCTFSFLHHGLSKFGVVIRHVDMADLVATAQAIGPRTRVVYFETPANPNMRIVDIAAVSALTRASGAVTMVDNTYATPYLTRPVEHGADLVVHSATKYLGGHGDLVAGLVAGSKAMIDRIRLEGMKDMTGAVMSPFTAMLIMRGLKTLELRMDRHCASARIVAEFLAGRDEVYDVFYPGLPGFRDRDVADRQMADSGGMIAFELSGGAAAGIALINRLELIQCAVSLGDAESLIQHPASMTHSTYTPEERAAHDISDGLVRLSVGLESVGDILSDLDAALDATPA